ncbi:structural protein MipA [Oceanisphaera profunda]|uniref:Structural protein MipA n=1 Tax=Oceanisphaera profunda TaxID=1416627 RepID=A0A1Y0D5G7_9GAMM|nr:MipA/OmpV family protein [Oceanisphaera profunda]ART82788.1 structural protein MipA [Oceanisphaera profunda]
MSRSLVCTLAILAPLFAAPALAQSAWNGSIGIGATVAPDYLGSDDYKSRLTPDFNIKYGNLAYLNWRDGLGVNVLQTPEWTLSPFIGYHIGRKNTGDLSRFDKVDDGLTAGVKLTYRPNQWAYSLKAEAPFTGDVDGYKMTLRADWRNQIAPKWFVGVSPSLVYSSSAWTQDMFNVSAADSARSGIARYHAEQGYWRLGLAGSVTYQFATDWSLTGIAGITQLTGDAKDSSIVRQAGDATQTLTGVIVSYQF